MSNIKEIVSGVTHIAHDLKETISHVARDITENIVKAVLPLGTNIENFLKEKGVKEVSRETCSGHETHNVLANGAGQISTNNDKDLTRKLFNHVLFSTDGESRLSNMASDSSEENSLLKKVENPATNIQSS